MKKTFTVLILICTILCGGLISNNLRNDMQLANELEPRIHIIRSIKNPINKEIRLPIDEIEIIEEQSIIVG